MGASGFHSVAVRQALVTIGLMLTGLSAFAFATIATVRDTVQADLLHMVDTDIAGLVDVAEQGGIDELVRRIGDRADISAGWNARPYYLLLAPGGRRLAGNLPAVPPFDPAQSAQGEWNVGGDAIHVRATLLRGQYALFVGRSEAPLQEITRALTLRLLAVAALLMAAALGVALVMARRFRARIAALNDAFARFEAGDLLARPPEAAGHDEFDVLGGHVARHLERNAEFVVAQRRISDGIAHELRTPLVHLDTRLLHLIEQAGGDPAVTAELECARADIRQIVSLFEVLLDIALTETVEERQSERVDLSELVGDLADLYAASAEEAGLAFTARIAPGIELFGEPMQISRMIANLLDNALKFAPAGCSVRMSLAPGPELVVEDNGPGIREAEREHIFQRFARAADGGSPPGHGLGLSLVRVIAARHGLSIRVEDARPGARFVISRKETA
ncbi:Signal transduction histidine kinase [Novosphingobium sp. CF614]|uniref:sensor histidine kinase n=1 Tax=Novosphingobium sp. CF614 TaxID=1884364 RepID=UPI0008E68965|nr:HAMP domain-containing sensor histidine kinase [Novosphingobium sp. CF614]SFG24529.1 Signal transduction histidine kinase [Novosphingobium sp. CF614]